MNELSIHESWTYGICERCLRNSHERVEMVREFLVSGNPNDNKRSDKKIWVCPKIVGFQENIKNVKNINH